MPRSLSRDKALKIGSQKCKTGYHNYITLSDNIQRERWVMLAGAVLGIATSILLFNTMNRLYFEEFRRAIFYQTHCRSQVLRNPSHLSLCSTGCVFTGICCEFISYGRDSSCFLSLVTLYWSISFYSYMSKCRKKTRCPCLF